AVLLAFGVGATLWLLDVRDWRCYGAVFLWAPVYHGLQTENVTIPLVLAAAVCWRFRDRLRGVAPAGGPALAAKIICWPLLVWLVATRRMRGAVAAVVVCVAVTVGLWAIIGFDGLLGYPSNANHVQQTVSPGSYTIKAVAIDLGLPSRIGAGLAI